MYTYLPVAVRLSILSIPAILHPVSSFYLDHRRRSSLAVLLPIFSLSPSRSCSRHIYFLSLSCLHHQLPQRLRSLHPPALRLALWLAFNPRRPTSAHRGMAWYTMRYNLPPTSQLPPFPLTPPVRLLALRHPSSSHGYSASQHRRRRENRYYGEINMIGRRMPRYPYT